MSLKESLAWIVGLLREQEIPFVLTGGFAVHLYGSARPVNDIDIDVRTDDLPRLLPLVQEYVTYGPAQYHNDAWDLTLLTLNHHGQEIDLSGAESVSIFDPRSNV
jgi:hypothetical protein